MPPPSGDGSAHALAGAKQLREMAKRMRDPRPALKAWAEKADKATQDAFRQERAVDGEGWPQLADSTVMHRLGKAGALKKTNRGDYTKRSKRLQVKLVLGYDDQRFKMLQITRVMANSARTQVVGKTKLVWSALKRLLPHMSGSRDARHPPQRNPTVFNVDPGSGHEEPKFSLKPEWAKSFREHVDEYVRTGRNAA